MAGTGLTQAVLEPGNQSPGPVTWALGGPWPFFPAPTEMRASMLILSGRAARVNAHRTFQQKAPEGQAPGTTLPGQPAGRRGRRCQAQPWVSRGEPSALSSDLGSIIFAGNVRTALTNNVWNHFQLFAFQVPLLRSGDTSR